MKMKRKKKNKSDIYGINRPKSRHESKYSKYKTCLSKMMVICIK